MIDLTKIAKDTLKMTDAGARVMGGMTKEEARNYLQKKGYTKGRIAAIEQCGLLPKEATASLISAAVAWWRGHKPIGWSEEEHIKNPTVNAGSTQSSSDLAVAVARLVSNKCQPTLKKAKSARTSTSS